MHSQRLAHLAIVACALVAGALGGLSACTVGPDFRGAPPAAPVAAKAAAFNRAPDDASAAQPSAAPWWGALGDPQLTALIEAALASSPDVAAAEARLRESRAALREQKSNALPKSGASASYINAELPKSTLNIGDSNLYSLGFDATWEVELPAAPGARYKRPPPSRSRCRRISRTRACSSPPRSRRSMSTFETGKRARISRGALPGSRRGYST